jgi:hypothetical protein
MATLNDAIATNTHCQDMPRNSMDWIYALAYWHVRAMPGPAFLPGKAFRT